jgi:hypothetical protein
MNEKREAADCIVEKNKKNGDYLCKHEAIGAPMGELFGFEEGGSLDAEYPTRRKCLADSEKNKY